MDNQAAEKFAALNKKQLETAVQMFQIGFGAWEMFMKLNLEAAKSLMQETVTSTRALASVQDPAGFSAWSASQFRAGVDKLSGYSRNIYEIGGQTAGQFGDILEQTLLDNTQEAMDLVDVAVKSSSIPQPEATAAAAKAAMENARSVIEGISKAVRQTAGFADANVRAAAAATAQAVKSTAK
jgi:phasin family protein